MSSKKIIVTGSNGQLGGELKELSSFYPQYQFIFFGREEFQISDAEVANKIMEQYQPQYLINCAAYTAVDRAESEKELANEINGTAVGNLALACKQHQTKFIHISTDYVFNGKEKKPLQETDAVDPINFYGQSKLNGEQLALQNNVDAVIIRTSWVYSSYGNNFVKTMMRLMKEREIISVVSDQFGSPTYAADLAEAIMQIISFEKWAPGIYNYSNEGVISWFDFACEIKLLTHSLCNVKPIATEQYPTPANRPKYSVLDKTKINKIFSIQLKYWKESLRICINKMDNASN